MSKERDLLIRVRDILHGLKGPYYDLYWDIQSALDQPEQEPVGIVITIGGYPDDSAHTVKLTCRHRDLKDGDLLYTAPPKREPLSDERELLKQLHVGRVVEYHRPHYPNNILYVHVVRFKEACGWTLGTGIVVNNLGREHTISLEEIRL